MNNKMVKIKKRCICIAKITCGVVVKRLALRVCVSSSNLTTKLLQIYSYIIITGQPNRLNRLYNEPRPDLLR